MTKLSGSCLCGNVSYDCDSDIKMVINCHCSDCRQATGSVYGTMVFVEEDKLSLNGNLSQFQHESDRGNTLTKIFCGNCGSQVMGRNSAREGIVGLRAGTLSQKEMVEPGLDIYCDSAIPSTAMGDHTKKFEKMPN